MRSLISFFIWIYWILCIIAFFVLICVVRLFTFPFDSYHLIPARMVHGVTWIMLKVNPNWHWEILGADSDKISKPTIVVANHQSFMDVMLLNRLPWTMKWVVWKPLFYIPFLGWLMYLTGQIGIKRESVHSLFKLETLSDPVKNGIPAMIFPEGERSPDGEVKEFRGGAFELADHHNFQILPVVLKGGYEALPKGNFKMRIKENFVISVLDPVSPDDFKNLEEMEISLRDRIAEELRDLKNSY